MRRIQLHAFILIILVAATTWAAKSARPTMVHARPDTDFSKIPLQFSGWAGREFQFSEKTYKILESCSLLLRYYNRGLGAPIEFTVIYGVDLGDFHQPEFCLEAQGLRSVKKSVESIRRPDGASFDAVGVIMEDDRRGMRQAFLYWFATEGKTSTSLGRYKTKLFVDRILGWEIHPSAMIRLSTQVLQMNDDEALERLRAFAGDVSPYLDKEFVIDVSE